MLVATDLGVDVIARAASRELDWEQVSEDAAECLRIESGRPRLGLDMDAETMPQEAGINERAVSFTKGCYVGQETVARLHYRGKPNRHLRGLELSEPAERRTDILLGEKVVGRVELDLRVPAPRPDRPGARAPRGGAGRHGAGGRRGGPRGRAAVRAVSERRAPLADRRAPRSRSGLSGDSPLLGRRRAGRVRRPRRRARPAARARAGRGPPTCATCAS